VKILVLNGPNLNMLGIREPDIYGKATYNDLVALIRAEADAMGIEVECRQSNHEGELVDWIQQAYGCIDGIVINPGAYTHTSVALLDAVKSVGIPTVEVHISRVEEREDFRQRSYIRAACVHTITGHGLQGYCEAAAYLKKMGVYLTPCLQSDTWHLKIGETFGATPDGRLANMPFSQNARPSNGACINGLTAMFNAMLNLPFDGILSGALNLDVDPKQFAGEAGRDLFGALLGSYFNRGGLHAQVSCANVRELIDAQIHPDEHRDLRVRVTGYSGVFVDICKRLQDDIIERFR